MWGARLDFLPIVTLRDSMRPISYRRHGVERPNDSFWPTCGDTVLGPVRHNPLLLVGAREADYPANQRMYFKEAARSGPILPPWTGRSFLRNNDLHF